VSHHASPRSKAIIERSCERAWYSDPPSPPRLVRRPSSPTEWTAKSSGSGYAGSVLEKTILPGGPVAPAPETPTARTAAASARIGSERAARMD